MMPGNISDIWGCEREKGRDGEMERVWRWKRRREEDGEADGALMRTNAVSLGQAPRGIEV
jgi:hypothetical protein